MLSAKNRPGNHADKNKQLWSCYKTVNEEVTIQQGFPNELRAAAAMLYDAAFGAKLSKAIPSLSSRISILTEALEPGCSFVAIRRGELVGIAGFQTAHSSLTGGLSFGLLKEKLGLLSAILASLVLALFQREQKAGQLLMDGIGVSPTMRGSGIGTTLLQHLLAYAQREGYRSVRLDVIDTNVAARRLYERVGFVPVRTDRFTYLKWLLGFGAATQMEYSLQAQR